jgi:hypothetical protein
MAEVGKDDCRADVIDRSHLNVRWQRNIERESVEKRSLRWQKGTNAAALATTLLWLRTLVLVAIMLLAARVSRNQTRRRKMPRASKHGMDA